MPSLSTGRRSIDMETPRHSNLSAPFRKVEVLYLLSRGAHLEHPHMINVRYAAHQPGPSLTDVKDRLIALRGKGMSESFSWSYKRNYKNTFIWCDLFDDDFILPLAESGEYVLKAIEIFDSSQDASDEELEYHSARESLPIKISPRLSTLSNFSRPSSESDMARKESLFLNTDISMDLSKHGSDTYPSFENVVANEKHIPERQGPRSIAARKDRIVSVKRCNSSPQSTYRATLLQRDGTMNCKETPTTAKKEKRASVFSPPTSSPRSAPARRRTWEKEIEKITIYTDVNYNKSSDDERPSPRSQGDVFREPDRAPGSVVSEESFLYLLRKATRLRSFRPRLCKGVDVVDSARTKTSKMHFRIKAKDEVNKLLFKSNPVKQTRASIDEASRNGASSKNNASVTPFPELVRVKNQVRLPEKTIQLTSLAPEKNITFTADIEPVKEFKTLAEYFESKEKNSPVLKLISELHSVAATPRRHMSSVGLESRPPGAAALTTNPQEVTCSSGNGAHDVTHRKTMEVLAQLSTSRRAGNTGAVRTSQGPIKVSEAGVSPVTQGDTKKIRSESKGNKQEVNVVTRSPEKLIKPSLEDSSTDMNPDQRRPVAKEPTGGTIASSENLAGSHPVEAAAKPSHKDRIKTPRPSTKRPSAEKVNVASLVQRPGRGTLDSRTLHSGNKQGVKTASQGAIKAEDAVAPSTPKLSSNEGAKGWPFEQPMKPKDFRSREDRPLIPGLTHMEWEKSFQEAAMHSEPPVNLVLHECSNCGRTFKLDSLQVHMRGCHAVQKSKSSLSTQRKRLSL